MNKNGFLPQELLGGMALVLAAVAALLLVNLGGEAIYGHWLHLPVALGKDVHHLINDGMMVLFFVVVGVEIRREQAVGALRDARQALLPVAAAVGGFVVPALVYVLVNYGDATALRGWAVPAATDIAFAVAVVAALGKAVPPALRIFLLTLAVVDDLLAIVVIALFFTHELAWVNLALAGGCVAVMVLLELAGVRRALPYVLLGLLMWFLVLESGVHATLAGVLTGLLLPRGQGLDGGAAERVEHALMPWVRWLVLPLFAFANVGLDLSGMDLAVLRDGVVQGIALGLVLGKPLGVVGMVGLLVLLGVARLPKGANWTQMVGVGCLCGIGFTMSLFIGLLAFGKGQDMGGVQLGVLVGTLVSAVVGIAILKFNREGA